MRTFLLIIMFLLAYKGLLSQNIDKKNASKRKLDSLNAVLASHTQEDSAKVAILIQIASQSSGYEGIPFYKEAIRIAQKKKLHKQEISVYHKMGLLHYDKGDYEQAMKYAVTAIQLAEKYKHYTGIVSAKVLKGLIYKQQNNNNQAIKEMFEAIDIIQKYKTSNNVSDLYMNIGNIYKNKKQFDSALIYQRLSLDLNVKNKNKIGISKNYNNIGNVYKRMKQYDSAKYYFKQCIDLSQQIKNKNSMMTAISNLSDVEYELQNYKESLQLSQQTLDIAVKNSIKYGILDQFGGVENKKLGKNKIQIQILIFIRFHSPDKCKVSYLAEEFNMTKPTISDSIKVLLDKGFINKVRDHADKRSYIFTLTEKGKQIAEKVSFFTSALEKPILSLTQEQKITFLNTLLKLIYELNQSGVISIQRMCFTCAYYSRSAEGNHYCSLLKQELADSQIRIDCPDQAQVSS